MTSPTISPAPSLLRRLGPLVLVAAVAFGVFANSFQNEFIYDDWVSIVQNTTIRSWSNMWELVNPTSTYNRTFHIFSYRPLENLSWLLAYTLFGLNAPGHHLYNIFLHVLNAMLVLVVLRHLTSDEVVALVGALAFAVHPIHIELVQVSAMQVDLLATPFFIAAILCHLRLRDRPNNLPLVWAGLAAVSYFLSCTGKEMGATVPLVAFFLDVRKDRPKALLNRRGVLPYIGYTIAAAFYSWLRFGLFTNVHQGDTYLGGSPLAALLTTGRIFIAYLGHLLLPFNIRPDYVITPSTGLDAASIVSWSLLAALAALAWFARHRHPTLTLGLAWLGLTLVPVTNLVPIRTPMADRFLYLPSVGFCVIVGWLVVEGGRAAKERWGVSAGRAVATLGTSVLVAWASITLTQNTIWRDDITLWSETARLEPDSHKAHLNLGVALGRKGRYVEAEEQLKATIRRWPVDGKAYFALGKIYVDQDKNEQAVEFLRRALPNLRPYWSAWAHFNLGLLYQRKNLREQAKAAYLEAIRLRPNFPLALNNLGLLWDSEGNYTDAGNAFHQAIASDPTYASPHYNLGLLYQRQNLREQAKAAYLEAIRLEPNSPMALNNLGLLWVSEDNYARAEGAFRRAIDADPSYARAHFNLGQTYERQGLKEQAKAAYREAIRLEQTYAKALNNLGILLESEGNYAKAEDAFRRAIDADTRHARAHYNLAQLYFKHLGAPKKALHHLEEVIRLEPNHPRIEQIRVLAHQLRQGG